MKKSTDITGCSLIERIYFAYKKKGKGWNYVGKIFGASSTSAHRWLSATRDPITRMRDVIDDLNRDGYGEIVRDILRYLFEDTGYQPARKTKPKGTEQEYHAHIASILSECGDVHQVYAEILRQEHESKPTTKIEELKSRIDLHKSMAKELDEAQVSLKDMYEQIQHEIFTMNKELESREADKHTLNLVETHIERHKAE